MKQDDGFGEGRTLSFRVQSLSCASDLCPVTPVCLGQTLTCSVRSVRKVVLFRNLSFLTGIDWEANNRRGVGEDLLAVLVISASTCRHSSILHAPAFKFAPAAPNTTMAKDPSKHMLQQASKRKRATGIKGAMKRMAAKMKGIDGAGPTSEQNPIFPALDAARANEPGGAAAPHTDKVPLVAPSDGLATAAAAANTSEHVAKRARDKVAAAAAAVINSVRCLHNLLCTFMQAE